MKKILIVTSLLLSACATATEAPLPTVEPVIVTSTFEVPTETPLPTATLAPTLEAIPPTQAAPTESAASGVSFTNQVLPIFQTYCVECHGGRLTRQGLTMTTYNDLMAGSFDGAVVFPGNANDSLVVQLIAAGEMPERGPAPSSAELQIIIDWINQGALNN